MEGELAQRAPSQADSPAWAQFQAEADLRKAKIARLLQVSCRPCSARLGQPMLSRPAYLSRCCADATKVLIQARCCA